MIDDTLRGKVRSYQTYVIRVNGEDIHKPYADIVNTGKHNNWEKIKGIKFFDLPNGSGLLAFGWLGELDLLGRINPSNLVDGLRVRDGNIMIGDKNTLSEFYREKRFSRYMVGELHVVDGQLMPNSRRDDFEDSEMKDDFYNCFIREIGIPYSRRIRELSIERSKQKKLQDFATLRKRAQRIIEHGHVAELQTEQIADQLLAAKESEQDSHIAEHAEALIHKVIDSKHVLRKQNGLFSQDIFDSYESVLEVIYRETNNKNEAEGLIDKILNELFATHKNSSSVR